MTDNAYLDLLKRALTGILYDESAWQFEHHLAPLPFSPRHPLRYFSRRLKRFFFARLDRGRNDLVLVRKVPFDADASMTGRIWPLFGYTMVGVQRLDNVQHCIEDVLRRNVPGDLMETGVWRGGCAMFMRAVLKHHRVTDRTIWAADSFEGLPAPKGKDATMSDPDVSDMDYFKVSLEQVRDNFARFGLLDDQVQFIKGWFCDSLPTAPVQKLAVLRLDGDMYSSTMDVLKTCYHKLSPGGYLILDDYFDWRGCRTATEEFREAHKITAPITRIDGNAVYWQVPARGMGVSPMISNSSDSPKTEAPAPKNP